MDKTSKKGKPRRFKNDKMFKDEFMAYIKQCKEKNLLANIAGFCVYSDINRDTYYAQKEHYPDTFKKIELILEDYTINANINDTFKIFYMKNKFNYKDRQEINANQSVNVNNYKELSLEELKKLAGE